MSRSCILSSFSPFSPLIYLISQLLTGAFYFALSLYTYVCVCVFSYLHVAMFAWTWNCVLCEGLSFVKVFVCVSVCKCACECAVVREVICIKMRAREKIRKCFVKMIWNICAKFGFYFYNFTQNLKPSTIISLCLSCWLHASLKGCYYYMLYNIRKCYHYVDHRYSWCFLCLIDNFQWCGFQTSVLLR